MGIEIIASLWPLLGFIIMVYLIIKSIRNEAARDDTILALIFCAAVSWLTIYYFGWSTRLAGKFFSIFFLTFVISSFLIRCSKWYRGRHISRT
jgi:hypothetical protein